MGSGLGVAYGRKEESSTRDFQTRESLYSGEVPRWLREGLRKKMGEGVQPPAGPLGLRDPPVWGPNPDPVGNSYFVEPRVKYGKV